eukprot:1671675-Pyramimonas_sp.AAC.1
MFGIFGQGDPDAQATQVKYIFRLSERGLLLVSLLSSSSGPACSETCSAHRSSEDRLTRLRVSTS